MRLKLCTNGEVLWGLVFGDELPGGVDHAEVAHWWREAAIAVLDNADIEYDLSNLGLHAWNGENTHTEQYGGLIWWGEPTTAERAAIERASDAAACAVRREALLSYADDVRHWTSSVSDLLADGENGADVDLAEVRELLERARSAHASLSEILREVLR